MLRHQKKYGWWDRSFGRPRKTKSKYTLVRLKRHHAKSEKGRYVKNEQGFWEWYSPDNYIQVQKKNKRGKWLIFKKKFKSENAAVDFLVAVVKKMQIKQHINGNLD